MQVCGGWSLVFAGERVQVYSVEVRVSPSTIILNSPQRVEYAVKVLGRLPLDGRGWDVEIRPHVEKRSLKANARLWALHSKAAEHLGYAADDMHEFALCRYFGYSEQKVMAPGGEIIIRQVPLKRSSTRDSKEFAAFMEATESWYIADFGVFLGDDE